MPPVTATNPSVYQVSGIIANTGSVGLVGGDFNGSVWPLRMVAGSNLLIAGSVNMASTILGSVYILGAPATWTGIGSIRFGQEPSIITGSVQTYSPLGVGSVITSGITSVTGSVVLYNYAAWTGIGSVISSGINSITGSVSMISSAGSIGVYQTYGRNLRTEVERGAFRYSGATIIGSVIGSYLITPGAGSKLFMKGFNASTEFATSIRLIWSGLLPDLISTFSIPNSGTVAMNMRGMEPSGATNQPIGVGLLSAGSVHISFFTEDSL